MLKISTVSYQEKSMDNYNNNGLTMVIIITITATIIIITTIITRSQRMLTL